MEAKYENSILLRLETLNAMIALVQRTGFNLYETVKGIKVVIERQDGTTVTEQLREEEIQQAVSNYIAEKNKLPGYVLTEETLKAIAEYITAQQAN